MARLSVLIFSRNDVGNALDLIRDVYGIADEIVLIDSSDRKGREELERAKRKERLGKLRVFTTVALGVADLLRMYGLMKCRCDWVLYLDTDERLNADLKRDIRGIIGNARCSAFAIKRYEDVREGRPTSTFFTWNIRLYRRGKVAYRGVLHEQPLVKGVLEKLDPSYNILHMEELRRPGAVDEYSKLLKFERLSYAAYNDAMVDYVSKLTMPRERSVAGTPLGKTVRALLLAYERLTLRKQEEELSGFDYFMYRLILGTAYAIKRGSIHGMADVARHESELLKQIGEWKREPDSREVFEISRIIGREGAIRYLGLDRESAVEAINRKYWNEKWGMDLTLRLLKERYEKGRGAKRPRP